MKRFVVALVILVSLALSFLAGSYYALRFQSVSYDADKGLYIMSACGQSEYYYIEEAQNND